MLGSTQENTVTPPLHHCCTNVQQQRALRLWRWHGKYTKGNIPRLSRALATLPSLQWAVPQGKHSPTWSAPRTPHRDPPCDRCSSTGCTVAVVVGRSMRKLRVAPGSTAASVAQCSRTRSISVRKSKSMIVYPAESFDPGDLVRPESPVIPAPDPPAVFE